MFNCQQKSFNNKDCSVILTLLVGFSIVIMISYRYTDQFKEISKIVNNHICWECTFQFMASQQQEGEMGHMIKTFKPDFIEYGGVQWKFPTVFMLYPVRNATILSPSGLVFNGSGNAFHFNKWYWKQGLGQMKKTKIAEQQNKYVMPLVQVWNNVFQHILFDTLPKMSVACSWLKSNDEVTILVMNNLQRDLLKATCDINLERFQIFKKASRYKGVYVPVFTGNDSTTVYPMGVIPPSSVKPLGVRTNQTAEVLYLSRNGLKRPRTVRNEKEVLETIKSVWPNAHVAKLENNWKNDRFLFANAKVIIGPHGGAFSNMVFAPENTTIIEFLPLVKLHHERQNPRPCYFGLAHGLGFNYFSIEPEQFTFNTPMKINIERLKTELERINKII